MTTPYRPSPLVFAPPLPPRPPIKSWRGSGDETSDITGVTNYYYYYYYLLSDMVIHFSSVGDGVLHCATLARLAAVSLILTDQRQTTKQRTGVIKFWSPREDGPGGALSYRYFGPPS